MSEEEAWPPEHLAGVKGMDLVRRVLEEAGARPSSKGKTSGVVDVRRSSAGGSPVVVARGRDRARTPAIHSCWEGPQVI